MIYSDKTIMYENGRDAGYSEGYEDALKDVAKVICNTCGIGGCPFRVGCEVYSDKACIERVIECLKLNIEQ